MATQTWTAWADDLSRSRQVTRIVERGEGAAGMCHCQKDNLHAAHLDAFNWSKEYLGAPPSKPLQKRG